MATDDHSKPSFSPGRKWSIGLNVVLLTFFVFAVVVMVNYLSRDYSQRFNVSSRRRLPLSPYTVGLLKSITNQVSVVLYYDRDNVLYSIVEDLLNEYQAANPKIKVQKVNYLHDPTTAKLIQTKYQKELQSDKELINKDLVIFDCEGRPRIVPGQLLAKYVQEQVPDEKEVHFLRTPVAFMGEAAFDAALMSIVSPKRLKAYFLRGHGEDKFEDNDPINGYAKFAILLAQNYIESLPLSLTGTNMVPLDCNLLVIAGPKSTISDPELDKIGQFLKEGGRLFSLFEFASSRKDLGLEKLFAQWGVEVGDNCVTDPENSYMQASGKLPTDVVVSDFSKKHALMNPLVGGENRLQMYLPRSVRRLQSGVPAADAPVVEDLAFTGPNAQIYVDQEPVGRPQRVSLIAAVEKGAIRDVKNERGTTRIVIAGDAVFLGNKLIDAADNWMFAGSAINWLLDRTELVQGPPPQPIVTYKILMTKAQLRNAEVVLLAAFPGAVLVLGALIWLRRRR